MKTEQKIYYTLRIASAMCLIGHGAFGIITKEVWYNYFAVFEFSHDISFRLMPVVGFVDILMGISLKDSGFRHYLSGNIEKAETIFEADRIPTACPPWLVKLDGQKWLA